MGDVPDVPKKPPLRLDYLDGMRALAALFVVLHHSWLQIWRPGEGRMPTGLTLRLTSWLFYGHFAVTVFLVISGFCLMIPVVRSGGVLSGGWRRFAFRRTRRIVPPYLASLAFSLVLIWAYVGHKTGTHWDISLPVTVHSVLAHIFLLQNFTDYYKINHAYWSIAVEYQIYFLFPLLVLAYRRFGAIPSTVVSIVLSYVWYKASGKMGLHIVAAYYLAMFVVGTLGAQFAFGSERNKRYPWTLLGTAGFIATILLSHKFGYQHVHFEELDLLVALSTMCLMVAIAHGNAGWLSRLLSSKLLVFIGGFSFSLYLVHAPLIQAAWQIFNMWHVGPETMMILLTFVGTPLIVLISYGFFWLFERPFLSTGTKPKASQPAST